MKTLTLRSKFETQLDCLEVDNSDTHGLKSGRQEAVRCRNATRRRSSSVKMAAPLATCNLKFSCGSPSYILILPRSLLGVGCQRHAPAALPPGMTMYPLCTKLGGPQVRLGRVWTISLPNGFDPRTVLPVASRYTNQADPAP